MDNGHETKDIVEARREVELAKADLRYRVQIAGLTGKRAVQTISDRVHGMANRVRPVLKVIAGVGAIALAIGLYKLAQGRRPIDRWVRPKRKSFFSGIARYVLTTIATRLVARALAPKPALEAANPEIPAEALH